MANEEWPELFTVAEVAGKLRVSKMTVYRLIHDGSLRSKQVGRSFRVPASSLRKYMDSIDTTVL